MNDRKKDIIRKLEKGGEDVVCFYKTLSPEQLDTQIYTDGAAWTARQLLAHLITIERSMHWLFRNILDGGPGSPENFDIERFNRTQPRKLDGFSFQELLDQFGAVRDETIGIVRNMEEADLDREGRHAFHGHGKLERFILWAHEHSLIHQEDVRRVLQL